MKNISDKKYKVRIASKDTKFTCACNVIELHNDEVIFWLVRYL